MMIAAAEAQGNGRAMPQKMNESFDELLTTAAPTPTGGVAVLSALAPNLWRRKVIISIKDGNDGV